MPRRRVSRKQRKLELPADLYDAISAGTPSRDFEGSAFLAWLAMTSACPALPDRQHKKFERLLCAGIADGRITRDDGGLKCLLGEGIRMLSELEGER